MGAPRSILISLVDGGAGVLLEHVDGLGSGGVVDRYRAFFPTTSTTFSPRAGATFTGFDIASNDTLYTRQGGTDRISSVDYDYVPDGTNTVVGKVNLSTGALTAATASGNAPLAVTVRGSQGGAGTGYFLNSAGTELWKWNRASEPGATPTLVGSLPGGLSWTHLAQGVNGDLWIAGIDTTNKTAEFRKLSTVDASVLATLTKGTGSGWNDADVWLLSVQADGAAVGAWTFAVTPTTTAKWSHIAPDGTETDITSRVSVSVPFDGTLSWNTYFNTYGLTLDHVELWDSDTRGYFLGAYPFGPAIYQLALDYGRPPWLGIEHLGFRGPA